MYFGPSNFTTPHSTRELLSPSIKTPLLTLRPAQAPFELNCRKSKTRHGKLLVIKIGEDARPARSSRGKSLILKRADAMTQRHVRWHYFAHSSSTLKGSIASASSPSVGSINKVTREMQIPKFRQKIFKNP
jgi:hypothetical protein